MSLSVLTRYYSQYYSWLLTFRGMLLTYIIVPKYMLPHLSLSPLISFLHLGCNFWGKLGVFFLGGGGGGVRGKLPPGITKDKGQYKALKGILRYVWESHPLTHQHVF